MHPLLEALLAAADGAFPPIDGRVEVLDPLEGDHHGVVEFTGHSVVLTDRAAGGVTRTWCRWVRRIVAPRRRALVGGTRRMDRFA